MKRWLIAILSTCFFLTGYSQVYINEILVANASVNYDREYFNFSSWIEIYNSGAAPVNLSGYYISDRNTIPDKWQLPDTSIPAGAFLLIWADGNNFKLHSNFNMNVDGEFIGLFNPSKIPVDSLTFTKQKTNISFGRSPDGTTSWKHFVRPTPGASNTTNTALTYAPAPKFSKKGGFYNGSQSVAITSSSPTAKIYYTLDGSEPLDTSILYTVPVTIDSTTVIRARSYDNGYLPGAIITHTFFIDEVTTVPVLSISVPPEYLWDDSIGIYVVGVNGIGSPPKNYRCPWERPANVEFFKPGDTAAFNIYCGVETFGLQSRGYAQKSLDVKFDEKYGLNKINYRLFKNRSYDNLHGFIARNSGTDWIDGGTEDACGMMFRDGLLETFPQGQMDVDLMSYQPAISFLNGQYWGIVDLREKLDKYYCNNLFDAVDKDSLDIIKQSVTTPYEVQEGDSVLMKSFFTFIKTSNMAQAANYQKAKDSIDIREFINYIIVETYSNNMDWISYNVKFWRQPGVIKWRWMLFDIERGFNGMGMTWNSVSYNRLQNAAAADTNTKNNLKEWTGIFLGSLLKNTEFKNEFAQTYAAHINTTYKPQRINKIIDSLETVIQPEIQRHIDKWSAQGSTKDIASWNTHVQWTHDFANQRPAYAWSHVKSVTGLSNMASVKISKTHGNMGKVYIQGATMYDSVMAGPYFNNIPIELNAEANPGKYFVFWEIKKNGIVSRYRNPLLSDLLKTSGSADSVFYTAVFRSSPGDTVALIQPPVQKGLISEGPVFTVFPNPVADELSIKFNDELCGHMDIIDLTGNIIKSSVVDSDSEKLNVSDIPAGIYLISVQNEKVVVVRKFIKN